LAVTLAAGVTSVAGAQTVAPYVKVVIDGSPVYLDSPPVIVGGRVLVPMRGVFERLGATVIWDPASQTIRAQRGPTGVALTIGASQATVNGQAEPLETPALLVGGRTMVPLRFISQALGASVGWDAASYTVQITSQAAAAVPPQAPSAVPPSVTYPPPPYVPAGAPPSGYPPALPPVPAQPSVPAQPAASSVVGTVMQVNAAVYPGQLSIQTPNGPGYTFQIVSGTTIVRINPQTGQNVPVSLREIRPGDAVSITADPNGTAQMVQALNYEPAHVPPGAPQPPIAPQTAGGPVTGVVTQVAASGYPGQLGIQTPNGATYTYQIVSGTAITRMNTTTGQGGPIPLNAIQPGESVAVTADPTGTAQSVQVSYAEISGTVASINNNQVVMQDGQAYVLAPGAQVVQGDQVMALGALQPGAQVAMRVNPDTRQVYVIRLRQAAAPAPGVVGAVTVTPAGRALVAGDAMTVFASGPAHGTATFSIAGLHNGLPMSESPNQPGAYTGTYVVQRGDYLPSGTVVVSITLPNGQVINETAPAPVSISAAAGSAPAAAGPLVIVSPAPGNAVTLPFTVTGTVPPGSQVKVTADYNKNVVGFNWHGTLGTQTVIADANGNWAATFTQKPPVRNVNVTITAVMVDPSGAVRSAPATVTTSMQ
jgi:hypothetical protein